MSEGTNADSDHQIEALGYVRGIQLGAGSLFAEMFRAFTLPEGSVERAAAMLALDEQVAGFLSLPGNDPAVALLALGRVGADVAIAQGERIGLDTERITAHVEQTLLAQQMGNRAR